MTRNKVKIVSNSNINTISYYLQNESLGWIRVSNSSELSRKEYTKGSIKEKIFDILQIINEIYNPKNRGVDLYFEGSDDDFSIIRNTLKKDYVEENIICYHQKMNIAVVGKIGSGKTTLIEELSNFINIQYNKKKSIEYEVFEDEKEVFKWYELNGIDLGEENIENCKNTLTKLAESEITNLIYCLSTNKIEKLEEDLILYIAHNYPQIKILIVLTQCIYEEAYLFAEQINKVINQAKIIPALAKDLKTRNGTISSFGLEQISQHIFEGK